MYNYIVSADPQPDTFTWTRDTAPLSSTDRIALTVNSISISRVSRSDNGVYVVTAFSVAGNGSANFTLNVYCELTSYRILYLYPGNHSPDTILLIYHLLMMYFFRFS